MTRAPEPPPNLLDGIRGRLPAQVDARVKAAAWASLVVQTLIVGTGGAVRLTGSGLGCPTWPMCTEASLVATPEMGIHGAIEFGNRMLSIVVGIVAILLIGVLLRLRSTRRDMFIPAVLILVLTVLQGVVGGFSVLIGLNPVVVGFHFLASAVLVGLAAAVVVLAHRGPLGGRAVPDRYAALTHATSTAVAVTVVVGVLTTGAGPHAGDDAAARNGLDPAILQHVHAWPAYVAFALTLSLVTLALVRRLPTLPFAAGLLGVELVQIAVGLWQARTGLPPVLVGIHMVLACILVAAMTATVLAMREPIPVRTGSADAPADRAPRRGTPRSDT